MILLVDFWTVLIQVFDILLGISLVESECGPGGITIEFEIQWDGDPDIVLDINTRVGLALPVQVMFDLMLVYG